MKDRFIRKTFLPLAAVLAALFISLPVQAQDLSKALPYRMRAGGRQVTPVEVSLPGTVVVLASEWVEVRKSANITGSVIVNDITPGPFPTGFALSVDGATVAGDVKAATVNIAKFSTVVNVCRDSLTNGGGTISGTIGPYSTLGAPPCEGTPPLFSPLPPFNSSSPGSPNVTVPSNGTQTIGPGRIGAISVGKNATLFVSGGIVEAASVFLDAGAKLLFQSVSELRVAGRFNATKSNQIGPASGSGIDASKIVVYVDGTDTSASAFDAAVVVGESNTAAANFYSANGTFDLGKSASLNGAVVAKRVILETSSTLTVNSAFTNKPPTAIPQTVLTNGATSVDIVLTGVDPEKEDLAFAIISGPNGSVGTITAGPTPIVPPAPPNRCSLSSDACVVAADCPVAGETCDPTGVPAAAISSATVTYTPAVPDAAGQSAENNFTFQVTDDGGLTGTAVVSINPFDNSPPPPAATEVTATNINVDTATNTPVGVGLVGGGPPAVTLTFRITSLPNGSLLDSDGVAVESIRDLPGPGLTYSPPPDSTGPDSFTFSVRNSATAASPCPTGAPATCATGTVSINITAPYELAPDLSASTNLNQPIEITLPGNPGGVGTGGGGLSIVGNAILPGADVAGGVADTTGDGQGNIFGIFDLVSAADGIPNTGSQSVTVSDAIGDATGTSGATVTWTLSGVLFDDTGSASGTFDYNASTETVSNWNITVSGGGIDFPGVAYTPGSSTVIVTCPAEWGCPATQEKTIQFEIDTPGSNNRQLRITPIAPLTSAGGSIAVNLNTGPSTNPSGSVECFNCSPFRLINAGSLSAPAAPMHDLSSATLSVDGLGNLAVNLQFDSANFDPLTSGAFVYLDTDQNIATGCDIDEDALTCTPGSSNDPVGWEYRIQIPRPQSGFDSTLTAQVAHFSNVALFSSVPFAYQGNGFALTVPLSALSNDDGRLNFLVESFGHSGPQPSPNNAAPNATGLDYIPDLTAAAGALNFELHGTVRLQVEWDLSSVSVSSFEDIARATVTLTTEKGATDSADTTFFSGFADQDGLLQPSDFQAVVSSLNGAVMPVPSGPAGQEGTFSFDVTNAVRTAIAQNFEYFSVQGRVDESGSGPLRGLQVRTTAPGSVAANKSPKLDLVIDTQVVPMLSWQITSLPLNGTLRTLAGALVTLNQTFNTPPTLVYTPNIGYHGPDGFNFQVVEGLITDMGSVLLTIINNDPCVINGREPGCSP